MDQSQNKDELQPRILDLTSKSADTTANVAEKEKPGFLKEKYLALGEEKIKAKQRLEQAKLRLISYKLNQGS